MLLTPLLLSLPFLTIARADVDDVERSAPKSNSLGPFQMIKRQGKDGKEVLVKEKRMNGQLNLPVDGGFYPWDFGFGNAGEIAQDYFVFQTDTPSLLQLSDCFCAGDRFIAHLVELDEQYDPIDIPMNQGCDQANASCNIYSTVPQECYSQSGWCKGKPTVIPAGYWNLTFEILTSPFLGGTGFALLQSLCPADEGLTPCCLQAGFPCYYSPCVYRQQ